MVSGTLVSSERPAEGPEAGARHSADGEGRRNEVARCRPHAEAYVDLRPVGDKVLGAQAGADAGERVVEKADDLLRNGAKMKEGCI